MTQASPAMSGGLHKEDGISTISEWPGLTTELYAAYRTSLGFATTLFG